MTPLSKERIQELLNSLEIKQLAPSELAGYFATTLNKAIVNILQYQGGVYSINVYEEFYDALVEGLQQCKLPIDYQDPSNVPYEVSSATFEVYCKNIVVQKITLEDMTGLEESILEGINPIDLFIRIVSNNNKQDIDNTVFLTRMGVIDKLKKSGLPFVPSRDEMRFLALMTSFLAPEQKKPEVLLA